MKNNRIATNSTVKHNAENSLIDQYKTIDKYFETHEKVQNKIISADYAHIQNKKTTNRFLFVE